MLRWFTYRFALVHPGDRTVLPAQDHETAQAAFPLPDNDRTITRIFLNLLRKAG